MNDIDPASGTSPRPQRNGRRPSLTTPVSAEDAPIEVARREIQQFLKRHSGYDVLPLSFRLMVLDTELLVKKALAALVQNGVASAPVYDARQQRLVGVLTMTHLIRLMHRYYVEEWSYDAILDELEQLTIQQLREKLLADQRASPVAVLHPLSSLYDAA
ncbi:hypothetical protein SYNPS1DRAFT_22973, partial [Syncephalis pseudoplumigaleata]